MILEAELKKQWAAKELRYKKPMVRDLNFDTLCNRLYDIQCACEDTEYEFYECNEALQDAFDGDLEEANEFRIANSYLQTDCMALRDDISRWSHCSRSLPDIFNMFFVEMDAGLSNGGILGFDLYEQDYYALNPSQVESARRITNQRFMRMTRKEFIECARQCFRIYSAYVSIQYRYDCLSASMDVLLGKHSEQLQLTRKIDELYEQTQKTEYGYADTSRKSILREFETLLNYIPQELWVL